MRSNNTLHAGRNEQAMRPRAWLLLRHLLGRNTAAAPAPDQ